MRTRLHFIHTLSVFFLLVSGDQKPEIRWKSNKSQIVHHSLDKTRKNIEQEAGWLPLHDTCAENLEIPKVIFKKGSFRKMYIISCQDTRLQGLPRLCIHLPITGRRYFTFEHKGITVSGGAAVLDKGLLAAPRHLAAVAGGCPRHAAC